MKVLWVTNTIFPEFSLHLGNPTPVIGGWMYGLASDLITAGIDLTVVTARPNSEAVNIHLKGITYYLLKGQKPLAQYDSSLEDQWEKLIEKTNPDLVHIHGSEFAHGLSLIKVCPRLNYIVSIQGLISVYSRYYLGEIPIQTIKKNKTFRDFLKNDSLLKAKERFYYRGETVEKEYFKNVHHFIGRTDWDFAHTKALNDTARYHFCNESLRTSFYSSQKWDIERKKDYSIFLSQAGYPIKGLHQVIKAIAYLKKEFPEIKIRIAGDNIIQSTTFREKISIGGYGKFILSLVQKHDLINQIEFTGYLDESKMIEEYLKCHVFICPSSIENSPNSLGEAQMLGTPCVASYVGGVPNMVEHGKTGLLYRFEEVEMLVQLIRTIFTDNNLASDLSLNGISEATIRHNREENRDKTLSIYKKVMEEY